MQRGMGTAAMRMVDGVLYVGTGKWLFQFHNPRNRFDERVIDIIEAADEMNDGRVVDWRILNAKSVDVHEETFLPHGGRKHPPIMISRYDVFNIDKSKIPLLFENELTHARKPCLDIGEALRQGRMRALYTVERSEGDKAVIKSRNSTASDYVLEETGWSSPSMPRHGRSAGTRLQRPDPHRKAEQGASHRWMVSGPRGRVQDGVLYCTEHQDYARWT